MLTLKHLILRDGDVDVAHAAESYLAGFDRVRVARSGHAGFDMVAEHLMHGLDGVRTFGREVVKLARIGSRS